MDVQFPLLYNCIAAIFQQRHFVCKCLNTIHTYLLLLEMFFSYISGLFMWYICPYFCIGTKWIVWLLHCVWSNPEEYVLYWEANYHSQAQQCKYYVRADSRFVPSRWEVSLLCNDVSHWLGTNLESALYTHISPDVLCWYLILYSFYIYFIVMFWDHCR